MAIDLAEKILGDPRFKGRPITWEIEASEYDQIRRAWLTHVIAEERLFQPYTEAEWDAQMKLMLSVMSDNCVFELVPSGERWAGQKQADAFYRIFIPSFSQMMWMPQALVIGPQGVLDVANMTGILERPFAGLSAVGQKINLQWVIYFPWIPQEKKFRGETIYSIRPLTPGEMGA